MAGTVPIFRLERLASVVQPAPPTKASLVRIYPASASGALVELRGARMTIGRDPLCDIEVTDDFISRVHAMFEATEEGWRIVDRGSLNGSYVNDVRIEEHRLAPGDQIRLGNHIYKFLSADDIEVQYHEAVYEMMTFDALTQTYNRRYFEDTFRREVLRSVRHCRPMALLLIDVDHFKQVNDRMGHLVGDEVLRGIAALLKRRTRGDEMLARYGGEEFTLAVWEIAQQEAVQLAEELRETIAGSPIATSRGAVPVTISIGVAHYDGCRPCSSEDILEQADVKLYEAKRAGRNRVCW